MRVGTLLGIAMGVAACAEAPSPVAPLTDLAQPPALSASVSETQLTQPFSATLWVSCADDGLGEMVALSGEVELHSIATEDENGGLHVSTHVRPSGVVGVGQTSGAKYRGTGGTFMGEGYDSDGFPAVYSFVNNFRIIGQGPGNNMLVHMNVHQTLDANGGITAQVDLSTRDCR